MIIVVEVKEGDILEGAWPEKLKVISVKYLEDRAVINAIGCDTEKFYSPILTKDEIEEIKVRKEDFSPGDGEEIFLFLEAKRIRNNFQFDPLCAINVSQIDPPPPLLEKTKMEATKMNKEEAKRVLEIMAMADGGCIYCGRELFNRFVEEFPEFTDTAREIFKKKFNKELEEIKDMEEA